MHKLTPHPRLPGHYFVESGDCVPLSLSEGQRIARLFESTPAESKPVVVAKSTKIETVSRSSQGSVTVKEVDPNRVFDSVSFFSGLKVAPAKTPARKSVEPSEPNDVFDSLFPFIR
jgi:hypothetical protein